MIYGKATDGSVDADEQIVDPEFAKKALAEWFSTFANVRQMHATSLPPAGKGMMLESMPDGEYVKSLIVEPTAMKLVEAQAYSGYSVGISRPRIVRDNRARGGRIIDGKIVELSIVDRPANSLAKFQIAKMAGNGQVDFVGKVVTLPAEFEEAPAPARINRYQKGAHITVHVRATDGSTEPIEGRVTRRGKFGAVELDTRGYEYPGAIVKVAAGDIVAAYLGSVRIVDERRTEDSVTVATVEKKAFPGAKAPFGKKPAEGSPAEEAGETPAEEAAEKSAGTDCDKCMGVGKLDGAECDKCHGTGKAEIVEKGADLSAVLDDVNAVKEDIKDVENDLEDITGQTADGDDKDDSKDDGDSKDSGDSSDDDPSEFDKVDKPKFAVVAEGDAWKVTKGSEVLGSHASKEAAEAQLETIKRERKLAKVARKAAKAEARKIVVEKDDEDSVPWLLKRAHDAVCPAYDYADVTEAYPSVEKGAVVSGATRDAIYAELADSVRANASTGTLTSLTKALSAVDDLITVADGGEPVAQLTKAALDAQHEAFKVANPEFGADNATSAPKPSESITPGQFKRPYLSAGHQQAVASDHTASIPATTHPIHASDFARGPLTDGHQRYIVSKISDLHDGLSSWKPELCRISQMGSDGSFAALRQPAEAFARAELGNQIPNQATSAPVATTWTTNGAPAPSFQFFPTAAPKVAEIGSAELEQAITKALEPALTKIKSLESEIKRMGAQPDPSAAPYRGIASPSLKKSKGKGSQKAGQSRREERVDYLSSLAASADPETRLAAQEQLARMGFES